MFRLLFKVYGAVPTRKKINVNFFFNFESFCENHPLTRHIKNKLIDFAPSIKSFMANQLPSNILERFLRRKKKSVHALIARQKWLVKKSKMSDERKTTPSTIIPLLLLRMSEQPLVVGCSHEVLLFKQRLFLLRSCALKKYYH